MRNYQCIELKFNIPFNDEISFHSHLYLEDNKIEIRVLLKDNENFSRKYMMWFGNQNDSEIISNYVTAKTFKNDKELIDISLSNSKVLSLVSEQYDEIGQLYFTIVIDKIILYKKAVEIEKEYAKIYLNQDGFDLVKSFYSLFTSFGNDGNVDIGRMKGMSNFYKLGKSKFRPEFEFNVSDRKDDRSPKIEKIPILKFYYESDATDEDIILYFSIACKICSFYLGNNIEFDRAVICRDNYRIILRNTLETKFTLNVSSLNWLLKVRGIEGFLKLNWEKKFLSNRDKLSEAITNYTHARLLDTNSRFMLLFSVIEICMGRNKLVAKKFELAVTAKQKKELYKSAFELIRKTIHKKDYKDFEKKWNVAQQKLLFKPMKSPLEKFLKSNKINTEILEISLDDMMQIRNNIIHGSVDPEMTEMIKKANVELFRITPILILNALGIKQWQQKT